MRFLAVSALLFVAACAQQTGTQGAGALDTDRTAWRGLAIADQAEHARALQMALESEQPVPVAWRGAQALGEVTVLSTSDLSQSPVCRTFSDRLFRADQTVEKRGAACWLDAGWTYVEPGVARPVLLPAFIADLRVYTVRQNATLATVARRTKTELADLQRLNPQLPERLSKGTRVLLP